MKALLFFIITFTVIAHEPDCIHCVKPVKSPTLVEKLLNWFSSQEKEIKSAPCKTKSIPTEAQMRAYIQSKLSGSFSWEVNGVQLKDESPILVQAFTDFTTAKDMYGSRDKKENQKNFQQEYGINPECEKTLCALEKIFGKPLALKMLYVNLKFGFNMSELAFDESERFARYEVDDVVMALEDLPPHLHNISSRNQRLTHFTRGKTLPIYNLQKTQANAVVMLFDAWTNKPSLTRQYTVFHELSHVISTKLKDMDESPEWLSLSGWEKYGDDWEANGATKCFVSNYGKANPWEDFAESISAYRYNGNAFKTQCPAKYNFIKSKVMNDIEYLTDKTCKP